MIQIFEFTFYSLLDPGESLFFVIPYIYIIFDVFPEHLSEISSVSKPIRRSILVDRVYRDCPIFVNHKSTMTDVVELDIVYFVVIICIY